MPVFRNIPHVERHIYKRTTVGWKRQRTNVKDGFLRNPDNLLQEVMDTNDLMFDVWFWTASEDLKTVMDKEF